MFAAFSIIIIIIIDVTLGTFVIAERSQGRRKWFL